MFEKIMWIALLIHAIWWVINRSGQSERDKQIDLIIFSILLGMAIVSRKMPF